MCVGECVQVNLELVFQLRAQLLTEVIWVQSSFWQLRILLHVFSLPVTAAYVAQFIHHRNFGNCEQNISRSLLLFQHKPTEHVSLSA